MVISYSIFEHRGKCRLYAEVYNQLLPWDMQPYISNLYTCSYYYRSSTVCVRYHHHGHIVLPYIPNGQLVVDGLNSALESLCGL